MSCGEPHETDCSDVLQVVYSFLDGELDDDKRMTIRAHLDECAPCLRQFGIEQEVKILVARCCGSDRAPDELRVRIVQRLHEVQLELGHVEFRAD
jgi:mycothiol system anti-sigma-R factor